MKPALLDTNIVSHILIKKTKIVLRNAAKYHRGGRRYVMNPITYFEVRRWILEFADIKERRVFLRELDNFVSEQCEWIDLTKPVSQKASYLWWQLRRQNQSIEDADLLIAATALVHECVVITENTAHFGRVPSLGVLDWTQ